MNHDLYLELERYVRLLLRRKRLLVLVTLLIMTLGVVTSYLLPKKFEAQSTVFIEQSVISDLVKGIAITPSMEAKIKVLSVSMLSRENMTKVLRNLDKDVGLTSDAQREAYLEELRERIVIKLDEKRGIVFLSFVDRDPKFARDLINTMAQVYIESNTASKRDESLDATRFLSEQIDSFKKRIDAVEEEINQYKAEHGMQLAVDETIIRFEI
ncbi:MAG: Wzz/FepE/Etk N-terminal domain-containing protein, partial [Desulfomicrobium apsheronum]|nr:Wzz/FepE/Etk N-terminal domain-containing protein [Desulfomicrobium apsheronum]